MNVNLHDSTVGRGLPAPGVLVPSKTPSLSTAAHRVSYVPSLAAAIVTPEGIQWTDAVGFADLEARQRATPLTAYAWFSMTKLVTATAVVQLCERQMLDLDDPISQIDARFRELRPRHWADRITVRHLLSHSGGVANPMPLRWVHPADQSAPDHDQFVDHLLKRHGKLTFEPGTTAHYSNIGYVLLGGIISAVSGQDYPEYIRSQVLTPLGMTLSDFRYTSMMTHAVATGYHPRWNIMTLPMRFLLPAGIMDGSVGRFIAFNPFYVHGASYGGLIGSVEDAAQFLHAHLVRDSAEAAILSPESTALMRQIKVWGQGRAFGLGWNQPLSSTHSDPQFVEHLGGGGGFWCAMRIYPDREVGIVLMGNTTSYDHDSIIRNLIDQWGRDIRYSRNGGWA